MEIIPSVETIRSEQHIALLIFSKCVNMQSLIDNHLS